MLRGEKNGHSQKLIGNSLIINLNMKRNVSICHERIRVTAHNSSERILLRKIIVFLYIFR